MDRRTFLFSGAALLLPAAARAADTVGGRYAANGKDATLAFASAHADDGMSGRPGILVVMTEKDHAASKRPDWDADFGRFGSALSISLFRDDGRIYGCQIRHDGLRRSPVSALGTIRCDGLRIDGERIRVRITSGGPMKVFDEPLDVDVRLDAAIRPRPA
jgi:hypothetical protein